MSAFRRSTRRESSLVAVVTVLALGVGPAIATPTRAAAETALCLRVQSTAEVDLTDASAVQQGIGSGEVVISEVVPCEAATEPAPSASAATGPAESATPVSAVDTGAWIVGPIEVDPQTEQRRAQASLIAESGTVWYGDPYTLTIACADGGTQLTVTWLWQLGPERLIGDGEVTTEPWFNDGQVTGYGRADRAFIESLFGETRLALEVKVPDTGVASAEFDITGIENAVANVREACAW